jgi:hypothetical protein
MTIGIGVLASSSEVEPTRRPDHLILLADTKGSFGDDFSMNHLHKLFAAPDIGLYCAGAGLMDRAAELFKTVHVFLKEIKGLTGYGRVFQAVHGAADTYKRVCFKYDVLPKYAYLIPKLRDDFDESDLTPTLLKEWQAFDFGCQFIAGSFDLEGRAVLFVIDGTGEVTNLTFPGFAAIGSGANQAMFWLSYRHHNLGFSVKRAAFHAFEAKVMAESSPFVNEQIDLIIASKEKWFIAGRSIPKPEGIPVSIAELRELLSIYGPKETDELK